MRVLITGAAGMLGRKLTGRLLERGRLRGDVIDAIHLVDLVEAPVESELCTAHVADLSRPGEAESLISLGPDVVFHLAAVVSAEAEADFDKGMAVNLDGTRQLFDAIRLSPITPRVVYASSIAVFGAPFPDPIPDDFHPTRSPPTAPRSWSARRCWPTTPAEGSSTASGSGSRPSASVPAPPTRPPRASSPASSANHSQAARPSCR